MAKNIKIQPQLSPENYIRQKGRNLPIDTCYVNSNWKEIGTANVLICRKHVNGNKTFAFYEVDLYCLGVKDSMPFFNIPEEEFQMILEKYQESTEMSEIEYLLAHNIVYAGYEYALELGIDPCKDFAVTRYLLEDDNDDIELIEIECGRNGKPFFIYNANMSQVQINRISDLLDKNAGKDHWEFLDVRNYKGMDDDDFDETEADSFYRQLTQEYTQMTPDQRREEFFDLIEDNRDENEDEDEDEDEDENSENEDDSDEPDQNQEEDQEEESNIEIKISAICDVILKEDFTDEEEVFKYVDSWARETDREISQEIYTPAFLGLKAGTILSKKDIQEFEKLDAYYSEGNLEKFGKQLEMLHQKWGEIQYLTYLGLKEFENQQNSMHPEQIKKALERFPDYPLLKMDLLHIELIEAKETGKRIRIPEYLDIFEEDYPVNVTEMHIFMLNRLMAIAITEDLNAFRAYFDFMDEIGLNEDQVNGLYELYDHLQETLLEKRYLG